MNKIKTITLILAVLSFGLAQTNAKQDSTETSLTVTNIDSSKIDEGKVSVEETKFFGDYVVEIDNVVAKKIRVIGGNLTVHGTVIGQIIVVGGDIDIKETAEIRGTVITLGGTITQAEGAVVSGKTIESNLEGGLIYREVEDSEPAKDSRFQLKQLAQYNKESWLHPKRNLFQLNRQEGVVVNFSSDFDFAFRSQVIWTLGYRTDASEKLVGRLTIERHFLENRNLSLYASFFNQSKTDDGYRLPDAENSVAMLLGRQDFYDRWNEKGWEYGAGIKLNRIKIKASLGQADQDELIVRNVKSLFEKQRQLRPDIPGFKDRKVETLTFTAAFRTENYHPMESGLALLFNKELFKAHDSEDPVYKMSDKVIDRTTAVAIAVLSPGPGLVLRTRAMAGLSSGDLYSHRMFNVGGLGSVSAHPYKAQMGNLMGLVNFEIFLKPTSGHGPYFKLFADGGHAWNSSDYGFEEVSDNFDKAISSYGFGLGVTESDDFSIGVNFAYPSDGSKRSETTVRFNYSF